MDFTPSETQQAIKDLATQILTDRVTPERQREVEADPERLAFDRDLWATLAEAGLTGVVIAEEDGGAGLGLVDLAELLEQLGRTAAPVPVLPVAVASLALARFGSAAQRATTLPGIADGSRLVTIALVEPLADPLAPTTTATPTTAGADGAGGTDGGWTLTGAKHAVPAGLVADAALVSATTPDGVGLLLVPLDAPGVTRERQDTLMEAPEARIALDGVTVGADALVGPLDEALGWLLPRATAAICAVVVGVAEAALALTASYTSTREQFGKPIATFQAVGQRAADAYIDTAAIRLTALQAIWRLDHELPSAKEVAVAKLVASEASARVARAAQHLHGGIGVDRDYPLFRYYLWAKQYELTLGSGSVQAAALGKLLADEPVSMD